MASGYEDFISADDFDAIMAILEEDENVEEQFQEAVQEIQKEDIICSLCPKICKSKRGLNRHIAVKHKESRENSVQEIHEESLRSTLTTNVLIDLVNDVKNKIANKVFTNAMRDEIISYQFEISEESKEFAELQTICEGLTKNGNAEKFYSKYYATIALYATKYFPGLSRNSATLLSTKLADRLLAHSKEVLLSSNPTAAVVEKSLQGKEIAGLQYLGGYVLQKLHNKHRTSKHWKTSESQQAISALKACKEECKNAMESQTLITSLNRGGLWSPTKKAQTIFLKAEHYFRSTCKPGQCQRSINIQNVIEKSFKDPDVVSFFNAIVSEASLNIENSVSKDILHSIIDLYIRVRSFSFARDIIQKHKIRQNQVKAKEGPKERNSKGN